jgi:acetate kinase
LILTLNPGSSSLKAGWFKPNGEALAANRNLAVNWQTEDAAAEALTALLATASPGPLTGILHRVVHGGDHFRGPVRLTPSMRDTLARLPPLAPLHNPISLALINQCDRLLPGVAQFALFDTAFHHTLPEAAARYALPTALAQQHGIRRYGFHGLSHGAVALRAAEVLARPVDSLNLISLHLGHGASACAIAAGRSVDTSMGMTPTEGLVMATRSGDVDAGALLHLLSHAGLDGTQLDTLLNRDSGLLGLCGEADMRKVRAAAQQGDAAAAGALAVYLHRLRRYIGAFTAVLGRVDALVFTGGVGENDADLREDACAGLDGLGIALDPLRNRQTLEEVAVLSAASSRVAVLAMRANEEQEMVRQWRAAFQETGDSE